VCPVPPKGPDKRAGAEAGERVGAMARILVIDDEASIRNLLDTALRRQGHEVVLAGKGRTGVNLFKHTRPQVTIVDLKLPDMGGLAVLQEIRALDPAAPVIILTGFGTEEGVQQARELGVTEFLQKGFATGFSLQSLDSAVTRVLTRSGQAP